MKLKILLQQRNYSAPCAAKTWIACGSSAYFVEIVKVEAVHFRFQYQYTFPISVTNFENEPQSI